MTECNYWLMKSEPEVYGINDLKNEGETLWDGIRNYQARNYMRSMREGDQAFFYHSNCKPPGIVGLMKIIEIGLIDPTQFDVNSKYFDNKSKQSNPKWDCVKTRYLGQYQSILPLKNLTLEFTPEELQVVRKGNRLSIMPVPKKSAKKLISKLGPLL